MGDKLFTPDALATLAGASFLTFVVVAYTKAYVQKWTKIPTDIYAVSIGTFVLVLAQLAVGAEPRSWVLYFIALANGFLVALQAGKMNDKAIDEYKAAQKDD